MRSGFKNYVYVGLVLAALLLVVIINVCAASSPDKNNKSPMLTSQHIDRDLVQLFSLIDKNEDQMISADEFAVFLELFYEHDDDDWKDSEVQDLLSAKIVSEKRFPFIAEKRASVSQLLNVMNQQMLGRPMLTKQSVLASDNGRLFAELWSLSFVEFEKIFSKSPHFAARNGPLGDDDSTCAEQVRLTLGRNTTSEMVIMWITRQSTPVTKVLYGTAENVLNLAALGTNYTYEAGVLGWDGWIHKVFVKDLKPATKYYYRVGSRDEDCWSEIFSFTTPSLPCKTQYPVSFATYGDMGTVMPLGFAVMKGLMHEHQKRNFDMVVHVGDISYAGTGKQWEFEIFWDLWGKQVSPLGAYIPYMVSVGNHEKYYNYTSFINRFHMPGDRPGDIRIDPKAPPSNANFFYSFDYEGIHFVSMCTERDIADYVPGTPGHTWLEYDLKLANERRSITPWIILLGHRPMYSSDVSTDSGKLITLEPLLQKYGVDLAIWGHMHCYERTWPVFNGVPVVDSQITRDVYRNPKATTHLTIGTSGAMIAEKFQDPSPSWSLVRALQYGFTRMDLVNATSLHFQFVKVDGYVLDDFWIIKE